MFLLNMRRAKLTPWLNDDLTDIETTQEEPNDDYFMVSCVIVYILCFHLS